MHTQKYVFKADLGVPSKAKQGNCANSKIRELFLCVNSHIESSLVQASTRSKNKCTRESERGTHVCEP